MSTYPFNIGIGDGNPQLLTDLTQLPQLYTAAKTAKFTNWRLMAAWNYIAKAKDPGTASFDAVNNVPTTTNRDWTTIDRCINDILLTGADPLLIIGQGRPTGWSTPSGGGNIFSWFFGLFGNAAATVTAADYGNFAGECAARYAPGGPGIRTDGKYAPNTGKGVTHFEIWNEENSPLWGANISATDYVAYLKAAYSAIKAVLPSSTSKVLFGGMQHVQRIGPWIGNGWVNAPEIDFLTSCYAAEPLLNNYYDILATHIYTQSDTQAYAPVGAIAGPAPTMTVDNFLQLVALRNLMVAKGASAKKMWITELGYETSQLSQALQQTYMKAAFDLLAALSYIDTVLVYNLRDSGSGTSVDSNTWGLFDVNFAPKAAFTWLLTLVSSTISASAQQAAAMTAAFSAVRTRPGAAQQNLALTATMAASLTRTAGATQAVALSADVAASKRTSAAHAQALALTAAFAATLQTINDRAITQLDLVLTGAFGAHIVESAALPQNLALVTLAAGQYVANTAHTQALAFTTSVTAMTRSPAGHTKALALTTTMAASLIKGIAAVQSLALSTSTTAQHKAVRSYTPSGNTVDTSVFTQCGAGETQNSGILLFDPTGVPSPSSGVFYQGLVGFKVPCETNRHYSEIVQANPSFVGASRPDCVAVGGLAADMKHCVIGGLSGFNGGSPGGVDSQAFIMLRNVATQSDPTVGTPVAHDNTKSAANGDVLRLTITQSGSDYIYTLTQNGTTILTYTDTGAATFGVPGKYCGAGGCAVFSAAWYGPGGVAGPMKYGDNAAA